MRNSATLSIVPGLVTTALLVGGVPAWAAREVERANRDTVGLVSGSVSGTCARFAQDLSDALDAPGELRVIPMVGKGSIRNIADLLHLRKADATIVRAVVLRFLRENTWTRKRNSRRNTPLRRGSARLGAS